jgi:hypothetical protein
MDIELSTFEYNKPNIFESGGGAKAFEPKS